MQYTTQENRLFWPVSPIVTFVVHLMRAKTQAETIIATQQNIVCCWIFLKVCVLFSQTLKCYLEVTGDSFYRQGKYIFSSNLINVLKGKFSLKRPDLIKYNKTIGW